MRAEDVTGIANKVAKRGERAQELIHKALKEFRESGRIEVYGNLRIVVTNTVYEGRKPEEQVEQAPAS
jgi:hypothetical protein